MSSGDGRLRGDPWAGRPARRARFGKDGVKRLVHISGIGADVGSPSAYVRARAVGERLVTEAFPEATILRPSVMFGPEDAFFNQLAALARLMPILPLCLGSSCCRDGPLPKRPISRDQVVLMKRDNVVGPKALSFAELGLAPSSVEEILPSYVRTGALPGDAGGL
jgi:uncharacterized protein YbjT (DUF2867 family)